MKMILVAASVSIILWSNLAWGVSVFVDVTPQNIGDQPISFTVRSTPGVSETTLLHIVITVRKGKLDFVPFYSAGLSIRSNDGKMLAGCTIQGEEAEGTVVYEFSISRDHLAKSLFTFCDYAHSRGRPMPAGVFYKLRIGDFANAGDGAERAKPTVPAKAAPHEARASQGTGE